MGTGNPYAGLEHHVVRHVVRYDIVSANLAVEHQYDDYAHHRLVVVGTDIASEWRPYTHIAEAQGHGLHLMGFTDYYGERVITACELKRRDG